MVPQPPAEHSRYAHWKIIPGVIFPDLLRAPTLSNFFLVLARCYRIIGVMTASGLRLLHSLLWLHTGTEATRLLWTHRHRNHWAVCGRTTQWTKPERRTLRLRGLVHVSIRPEQCDPAPSPLLTASTSSSETMASAEGFKACLGVCCPGCLRCFRIHTTSGTSSPFTSRSRRTRLTWHSPL